MVHRKEGNNILVGSFHCFVRVFLLILCTKVFRWIPNDEILFFCMFIIRIYNGDKREGTRGIFTQQDGEWDDFKDEETSVSPSTWAPPECTWYITNKRVVRLSPTSSSPYHHIWHIWSGEVERPKNVRSSIPEQYPAFFPSALTTNQRQIVTHPLCIPLWCSIHP